MVASSNPDTIVAEIQYLVKDPKHDNEQPYYLYYEYGNAIPRTNTINDSRYVSIYNARNINIEPGEMFKDYGFAKMNLCSSLSAEEHFDSVQVKQVIYPECLKLLRSLFPEADRVEVLEHGVLESISSFGTLD